MSRVLHPLRRRLEGEDGFTLIEAMMAITILLTSVLAVAYTASQGFTNEAFARQQLQAAGLADRAMEEIRALPFAVVGTGLDNTDLSTTTDPNIAKNCAGVVGDYCYNGERIPHGNNSALAPLVPHQQSVSIGNISYTVSAYVTWLNNDTSSNAYRATVIVTWPSPELRGTTKSIHVQTIISNTLGCPGPTHPFAAPCQPFLYSSAQQQTGTITVSGTLQGVSLDHASLWSTRVTSSMQIEQVSSVFGESVTSGASVQQSGATEQFAGVQSATSSSDNDPQQSAPIYSTASVPAQSAQTLTLSGGGDAVSVTSSGSDPGTTTSTTVASTTNACANGSGTAQTDSLPCGNSNGRQAGSMTMTGTFNNGSASLGTATMATMGSTLTPGVAFTNRDIPTSDGRVHSDLSRTLGTITLGGLPTAATAPHNWAGYLVQLSGFSDSVSAEAGVNSAAPTVTRTGTVKYWNGTNYTTLSLTTSSSGAITIPTVTVAVAGSGTNVSTISLSANLSIGADTLTDPAACGTSCTRSSSQAVSNSPLIGDITYVATSNSSQFANLDLHVDLGTLTASNTYTPGSSSV